MRHVCGRCLPDALVSPIHREVSTIHPGVSHTLQVSGRRRRLQKHGVATIRRRPVSGRRSRVYGIRRCIHTAEMVSDRFINDLIGYTLASSTHPGMFSDRGPPPVTTNQGAGNFTFSIRQADQKTSLELNCAPLCFVNGPPRDRLLMPDWGAMAPTSTTTSYYLPSCPWIWRGAHLITCFAYTAGV